MQDIYFALNVFVRMMYTLQDQTDSDEAKYSCAPPPPPPKKKNYFFKIFQKNIFIFFKTFFFHQKNINTKY
jgi:hypothetical protein